MRSRLASLFQLADFRSRIKTLSVSPVDFVGPSPTKRDQIGFQVPSECAAPSYVVNIEILISAGDLPPAKRVCTSLGSRARNYVAAVPTVDSKILVGPIYPDRNISTSPLNIVSLRRQFPDA